MMALHHSSGSAATAPRPRSHRSRAASRRSPVTSAAAADAPSFDPRQFRRELGKSEKYTRRTTNDEQAVERMKQEGVGYSKDGLVAQMRETGYGFVKGDTTFKLAESYGFCWGVERAVQMAYEAKRQFPGEQLHITNEIIHNPIVNERLADMGVQFIEESPESGKDFSAVNEGDVVILPAFGASVHEMKLLSDKGVNIVDTTCPWVSKVWNAVDLHTRKAHTSIIHGKWAHEETIATASFASTYLVVKNLAETNYVCDYIVNGGNRDEFFAKFDANAMSAGFDPDADLESVGIANQTTMLKGETEMVGKLFEKAMMERYGVGQVAEHFMVADTICDATQERQDAMYKLVDAKPDVMLVVGGFNSSNTEHLQEISEDANIPSYWVDSVARLSADGSVAHRLSHGELVETPSWLPEGPVVIGVTSGASTPDKVVEDVLEEILRQREA